jgi:hypothetical protein
MHSLEDVRDGPAYYHAMAQVGSGCMIADIHLPRILSHAMNPGQTGAEMGGMIVAVKYVA